MQLSPFLKFLSIAWVGGVLLLVLLVNGNQLYGWIGLKAKVEIDEIKKKLDLMFITMEEKKLYLYYTLYLVSLFFLSILLFWPGLAWGIIAGAVQVISCWTLPKKFVNILHKQRVKKFVTQMVEGLALMSNGMRSGLNVPQALQIVSDEMPNPISQEFQLILSQNKLGVTLEDAMTNLAVRMKQDDIEMFATSVNILKETGGNLAETFDNLAHTIRERIKVEAKISAMVTQGVTQGVIVVLMPFALAGVLYTIDPERIRPMFTTPLGLLLVGFMLCLQIAGGYTIWKIVQIRV